MGKKIVFSLAVFGFFVLGAFAGDQPEGWHDQNGKMVKNSDNIKMQNGFGAQLWVISNENFFEEWKKPETPKMNIIKTAIRNKPVFAVIFFASAGVNEKGESDVTFDFLLKNPNGGVYAEQKGMEAWVNKKSAPAGQIQLAIQDVGIVIEDKDPAGKYRFEAVVHDNIKKVSLPLVYEFTVEK